MPTASEIIAYFGILVFIAGSFGNIVNILLFWRNRQNPCALLFCVSSMVNCVILVFGLLTRIFNNGFHLDWSTKNRVWCKLRVILPTTTVLISLTCTCLASIDRFLVSCRQEKYRRLSRLSWARVAAILTNIFWFIHFSPYFYYIDVVQNPTTGLTSCWFIKFDGYVDYVTYIALPMWYCILPITTVIISGLMAYKNMSQLQIVQRRESLQRQLTLMMVVQIPIILFSTLPYVVLIEYSVLSSRIVKSASRMEVELLITDIVTLLCYFTFASPFYGFLISSQSFRNDAKSLILCRKREQPRLNQVRTIDSSQTRRTN